MKKIEIFKRRLIFKIEKKEEEEREYDINPEEILGEKIVYLIILIAAIVISSKVFLLSPTLDEGDVVTKDIIAPRDLKYNDRLGKENLVASIISGSEKQYIYIPEVEKNAIRKADTFYRIMLQLKGREDEIDFQSALANLDVVIDTEVLEGILKMKPEEIEKSRERVEAKLREIYSVGVLKGNNLRDPEKSIRDLEGEMDPLERAVVERFLTPNYIFDEESTRKIINDKISQVDDVIVEIKGGSLIAGKGDILTKEQISRMRAYGIHSFQKNISLIISYFIYLLGLSIIFYSVTKRYLRTELLKKSYFRSTFLIVGVTLMAMRLTSSELTYLLPVDAMFFLLGILVGPKFAAIMGTFLLSFSMPLLNFDLVYYLANIITFLLGLYLLGSIKNRTTLINAGVKMGFIKMIIVVFVGFILREDLFKLILDGGAVLLSGIFSGMLTIALLPYFEKTFNILTTFKLLELGDLSHPLLKELSVNTPGTFHHSMMVATLSENAAESIGANAVFARVAAYYHDIGKMKRPNFYVENQRGGENPHNKLTPSMSNLIITAHTKDGVEMAKEQGIPKEIRDIMIEHQGTTLLAYFYNKAKQQDPNIQESDFRYSGPKPRTKESAIIMLADSIEAAVRSLDHKTPITIEKMIRKIINGKIEDNQLSEADLTFKEIEIIIHNFTKVLMGIHHIRLKYPGQKG